MDIETTDTTVAKEYPMIVTNRRLWSTVLLAVVFAGTSVTSAEAQGGVEAAKTKLAKAEACCAIVAVNPATGAVTLKVLATGVTCYLTTDRAALRTFVAGDQIALQFGGPTGATGQAASSTTSGGGSACGSNVPRNADTRPKDCIATNSAGQQSRTTCPPGVPIKTAPR